MTLLAPAALRAAPFSRRRGRQYRDTKASSDSFTGHNRIPVQVVFNNMDAKGPGATFKRSSLKRTTSGSQKKPYG
ncbi:hypothetical protein JOB18_046179 [Solea senegalensis]|uniref:Uncharacterized protein n=1 Tax=Solea senegalensis TaxID=28829 RepID=A0AAV6T230_SOLSE|nr:hypothetical protein JOB18_046179 [Solea senegalensis]